MIFFIIITIIVSFNYFAIARYLITLYIINIIILCYIIYMNEFNLIYKIYIFILQ